MKKTIISFVVFFGFVISCSADSNDKQIRAFWDYVKVNETKIINATNQDVSLWNELNSYLQKIDKSIYTLVSKEGTNAYIIITAGGNKDSFKLCDYIVQKAIKLNKLKPISLIPPSTKVEPFIYEMPEGKIYFTTDDVFVHCDDYNKDNIELLILLSPKHQTIVNKNTQYDMQSFYYNMCIQMIMQVLGEKTMGNRISKIDIVFINLLMPTVPLKELSSYVK